MLFFSPISNAVEVVGARKICFTLSSNNVIEWKLKIVLGLCLSFFALKKRDDEKNAPYIAFMTLAHMSSSYFWLGGYTFYYMLCERVGVS